MEDVNKTTTFFFFSWTSVQTLVSVAIVVANCLSPVLRVDIQCRVILTCVKVTFANKIEAMHERSLVSVKVEHRSTFKLSTFYVIKILRALTCVANSRQWKSTLTDATWLTNNSQHCWMLHVASVCTSCCMYVVGSFCAKFETGKTCCVRLHVALSSVISVR